MITLALLAAGAALVLVILVWSLCAVAAGADRRRPAPARCARCAQPVPPRRGIPLLWCSEACAFLWLEEAS